MSQPGIMAVDAVFAMHGIDATYVPQSGPSTTVRVVSKAKDEIIGFDTARIHAETRIFEMRRSEPVTPKDGEKLVVDGIEYLIQGKPQMLDTDRLVWTLDTRPV